MHTDAVSDEDLWTILEAAIMAPSGGNVQPWNFVVVTDREHLVELAKAWPQGGRHIAGSAATSVSPRAGLNVIAASSRMRSAGLPLADAETAATMPGRMSAIRRARSA